MYFFVSPFELHVWPIVISLISPLSEQEVSWILFEVPDYKFRLDLKVLASCPRCADSPKQPVSYLPVWRQGRTAAPGGWSRRRPRIKLPAPLRWRRLQQKDKCYDQSSQRDETLVNDLVTKLLIYCSTEIFNPRYRTGGMKLLCEESSQSDQQQPLVSAVSVETPLSDSWFI